MDESILKELVAFMGGSIASGITWDVLKGTGKRIIQSFVARFHSKGFFETKKMSEEFLEKLAKNECYDTEHPMNDVKHIYKKLTGKKADANFEDILKGWIEDNLSSFSELSINNGNYGININHADIKDSTIYIANKQQINN